MDRSGARQPSLTSQKPNSTYEIHYFPTSQKLNSTNVHQWTDAKIKHWPTILQQARSDPTNDLMTFHDHGPEAPTIDALVPPPKNAKHVIVLDFHNVFNTDVRGFVAECSLWNASGCEVHVCSFVVKGTATHASLLATFDNPLIQKVIKSLLIVFDRKHPKKGKGHVIQKFLLNEDVHVTFVDDEPENLQNCHEVVHDCSSYSQTRIHYIHYVQVLETRERVTPAYATRIDNFAALKRERFRDSVDCRYVSED